MLSGKHGHPEENIANKGVKKMDKVITGLILGGIIASIYGMKKSQGNHAEYEAMEIDTDTSKRQKRGIFSRIFFGDK